MNTPRTKNARLRLVSLLAAVTTGIVLGAAPAGASTGVVLANEKFKWFYWIGFVLAVSLVLWLIATLIGYYVRVLRPKSRGRHSSS